MLTGVDVSHWQGVIDWGKVAPQVKFAILKCTEGATYQDISYPANKVGCDREGILHGVYHFFRSNADPVQQAENFYNYAADPGLDFWCVDVEVNNGGDIRSVLKAMLQHLEQLTGKIPWVYSAKYFWNDNIGAQPWASRCPLWVANYGVQQPALPNGWSKWGIWQYSSHGAMDGIQGDVDMNIFNDTDYNIHAVFEGAYPIPIPDKVRVIANSLNVRLTPNGTIWGAVPYGTIFGVIGQGNDSNNKKWWKVGSQSWVASWWCESI
jgi:lysozyme